MATKVTATQRKHASNSLLNLYTAKAYAIRKEFGSKAENELKVIPTPVLPTPEEAMKALMGLESRAVLTTAKEDIARGLDSMRHVFNINPLHYVRPLNFEGMEAAKAYNEVIAQRHREEVDGRLALLKSAYSNACDVVALSDSGDALLRAVQDFEARVL